MIGIAAVHLNIAGDYKGVGKNPLSLSDQFYAQAVIALLLALALIVKPHLLVWLAAAVFGIGSIALLIYSRYQTLPVYGFPPGFQETWMAKGSKLAAIFEGLAIVFAVAGAAITSQVASHRKLSATSVAG